MNPGDDQSLDPEGELLRIELLARVAEGFGIPIELLITD